MGLLAKLFGEGIYNVVTWNLSVDDLARVMPPDSKLGTLTAKFTRSTSVGPMQYSLDYRMNTVVEFEGGHRGPYILLSSSKSYAYLPFAHYIKQAYSDDIDNVEGIIAESTGGHLGRRNDFDFESGDKHDMSFYRYILLPRQLTREEFVRIFRSPKLQAENVIIREICFGGATLSDRQRLATEMPHINTFFF